MNFFDEGCPSMSTGTSNSTVMFDFPALDEIKREADAYNTTSRLRFELPVPQIPSGIPGVQTPSIDMGNFSTAFSQQDASTTNLFALPHEFEPLQGFTGAINVSLDTSSTSSIVQGMTDPSPSLLTEPTSRMIPFQQREVLSPKHTSSGVMASQLNSSAIPSFSHRSQSSIYEGTYPRHAHQAWVAKGSSLEATEFQEYAADDVSYTSSNLPIFSGLLPSPQDARYHHPGINPFHAQMRPPTVFSTERAVVDRSVQFGHQQSEAISNVGHRLAHRFPLGAPSIHAHRGSAITGLPFRMDKIYQHDNCLQGHQELKGLYPQPLVDQDKQHLPSHPSSILRWGGLITVTEDGTVTELTKANKEQFIRGSSLGSGGPIRTRRSRVAINDPTKHSRPYMSVPDPSQTTRFLPILDHEGKQVDDKQRRRRGRPKACDREAMKVEKWRCKCCNQGYGSRRGFDAHFRVEGRCPMFERIFRVGQDCAFCLERIPWFPDRDAINEHAGSCKTILALIEKYGIVSKKCAHLIIEELNDDGVVDKAL